MNDPFPVKIYHVAFSPVIGSENHVTIATTSPLVRLHEVGVYSIVAVGGVLSGTVMVSVSAVTVPRNAKALPVHVMLVSIVMPALSITVPINVELVPSVVAVGVQNIYQTDAPLLNVTCELADVVSAPLALKI